MALRDLIVGAVQSGQMGQLALTGGGSCRCRMIVVQYHY